MGFQSDKKFNTPCSFIYLNISDLNISDLNFPDLNISDLNFSDLNISDLNISDNKRFHNLEGQDKPCIPRLVRDEIGKGKARG